MDPALLPQRRFGARDALAVLVLALLLAAFVLAMADFSLPPYEDAAILMRYARHIAEGHGIVWNVGGQPVDGATDFFLMVTLGAMGRLGLSIDDATVLLGLASHALTVFVVYLGVRRLHGAPVWMALLSAAYLALGPGMRYVEAYFGTPYFALFSATTFFLAYLVYREGESWTRGVLFALSSLLLGLTRPEGVFLGLFMLGGLLLTRGLRPCRRTLLAVLMLFGIPGAAYFLWRWQHFGHPLPNTYYIKGRDVFYPRHLINGTINLVRLALPFVPIFVCALLAAAVARARGGAVLAARMLDARELVFVLVPPVAFTALNMLHEGLMDFFYRFQYALLPPLLLSWPPFLQRLLALRRPAPEGDSVAASLRLAVLGTAFGAALAYPLVAFGSQASRWWGTYEVARILENYPQDYTMAVTNAGHLPYVSGWNAVDGWRLNDQEIAHEGLSEEILERHRPELIQFDAAFSPLVDAGPDPNPWSAATRVMKRYAEKNGYVLAAAYGLTPYKSHYYYVRPDFPESDEIVRQIRETPYWMAGNPTPTLDFAALAASADAAPE